MEVIISDVKLENNLQETQIIKSEIEVNSGEKSSSQIQNSIGNSVHHYNTPCSTRTNVTIGGKNNISTSAAATGSTAGVGAANTRLVNSAPVRTILNEKQLHTMAKSSVGLSIMQIQPQTVIQSPSVIQSSGQIAIQKGGGSGNVILVSKGNSSSVIQTTSGAVQVLENNHNSDESLSNDGVDHRNESKTDRKRREILTRRPSYRKILSDLGGSEISADKGSPSSDSDSQEDTDSSTGNIVIGNQYPQGSVVKLGLVTTDGVPGGLQTITMTNSQVTGTQGGTIVQYAQSHDGSFFVPVGGELQAYTIRPVPTSSASHSPSVVSGSSGGSNHVPEEQTRKREIRLLKNREAARECRRKKKEYIKCLENRVAVLENQNKALIDELKSLKELYCNTQKTE